MNDPTFTAYRRRWLIADDGFDGNWEVSTPAHHVNDGTYVIVPDEGRFFVTLFWGRGPHVMDMEVGAGFATLQSAMYAIVRQDEREVREQVKWDEQLAAMEWEEAVTEGEPWVDEEYEIRREEDAYEKWLDRQAP